MAQRELGQVEEAFALNADTLQRLRDHYGTDDDTYLIVADSHSEDLRVLGKYDEALENDFSLLPVYDQVFSPGQFWPLSLRNNIAIDLRCVGRYEEALEYDTLVADAAGAVLRDQQPAAGFLKVRLGTRPAPSVPL